MEGFFWNFGTLVIRLPVLPRQFSHLDFFRACGDQFRTQYLGCMCVCVTLEIRGNLLAFVVVSCNVCRRGITDGLDWQSNKEGQTPC